MRAALEGKLALVTGGSSGIGASVASALAARGAHVILVARDPARLDAVAARIRAAGGTCTTYIADLADPAAVQDLGLRVASELGTPDILINSAGAGRWLSLLETSAVEAAEMVAAPYLAAFNVTREFVRGMVERRSGRVVNVTSVAARLAWPGAIGYIAARRAMEGFHAALGAELFGTGVSATLVVLGTVESPYWEHNPGSRERVPTARGPRTLTLEEAADAIVSAVEHGRRRVVRPASFRLLFLLSEVFPGLMEKVLAGPNRGAPPLRPTNGGRIPPGPERRTDASQPSGPPS